MLGPQTVLAEFGELHPAILRAQDLDGPRGRLRGVPRPPAQAPAARPPRSRPPLKASPFQPVDRDFAFVVADDVAAESLLAAVRAADKALIREVALFDVYAAQGLGAGMKSLALAVRLQAPDHTLTEAEIEAVAKKIIAAAAKATGRHVTQLRLAQAVAGDPSRRGIDGDDPTYSLRYEDRARRGRAGRRGPQPARGVRRSGCEPLYRREVQMLASVPLMLHYEVCPAATGAAARPAALSRAGGWTPLLDAIAVVATPVTISYLWRPMLRDPDDELVLETAVNGQADLAPDVQ